MTEAQKLTEAIDLLSCNIHQIAVDHGWWEQDRNDGEMIALMHSELSEVLDGLRHGNPPSDHIPQFSSAEEEYADTIIRILDTCKQRGYRIAEALIAKVDYNRHRPYKHGGKKF